MDLTSEKAQRIELETRFRIKFAAIDLRGDLVGDAHDEYRSFFDQLPPGWSATMLPDQIETRTEHLRPAWHLTNSEQEVLAVEHETGVEILLIGVLTTVIAEGLIAFTRWGWKRWGGLRRHSTYQKVNPSLVIEIPRHGAGEPPAPVRLVVSPPVSDEDIARYISLAASIANQD